VPTHRTGLASALAACIAEIHVRRGGRVRLHHLGVPSPAAVWDRWEGSSFLDPGLYERSILEGLYVRSTHGGDLSLLAASQGPFDTGDSGPWTPLRVAEALDCPCVLVLDCRGWGESVEALAHGFAAAFAGFDYVNLAGAVVGGLEDAHQAKKVRRALERPRVPVFGYLFQGEGVEPNAPAPGPWGLPLDDELLETVLRRVDLDALEAVANQRGFLTATSVPADDTSTGPLVMVAGGRGFTPWSRDSIDLLREAGAMVRRLDLVEDTDLPGETAGLVLAGEVWPQAMPDLAANLSLMRSVRSAIEDGMPTLALGGGMIYLLRAVQDVLGRRHEMAGLLPVEAEIISLFEEPVFYQVAAERDTILLQAGDRLVGWMLSDVDIMDEPVTRNFPLCIALPGSAEGMFEGAASPNLLCSRLLMHLASNPSMAKRFVAACRSFAAAV